MFLSHVHTFRGVAIVGIIGAHSLQSLAWDQSSLVFQIIDTLCNQSSIWFFFIAGLLFQHLSKRYQYKNYLKNKLRNVIIPYLILSIPAIYASMYLIVQDSVPKTFYEKSDIEQALLFLITGKHLAPFWFVPTITLFYIISPLLLKLDRAPKTYFLLPLFVALSAYLGRDGFQALIASPILGSAPSKAIYLLSIYVFGMYCGRNHELVMSLATRYNVILWLIAATFFTLNIVFYQKQVYAIYFFKLVTCISILPILHRYDRPLKNKFYLLGDLSFGLFFIHGYLLAAIRLALPAVGFESSLPSGIINYLLFVMVITATCTTTLTLGRRVLGSKSRMIIGC